MDLIVYHIWPRTTTYGLDSVSYLASNYLIWNIPHMGLIVYIFGIELPHMDLIVYHIWLLELPHMDLIVYHIWPRTTTYGLDSVSYLASNYHILIVYHIWPR